MTASDEFDERHVDLILGRARKALQPCLPSVFNGVAPSPQQEALTDERLRAAYETLASIVSRHGEVYLPLFERLHYEIQNRESHSSFVTLARSIHERTNNL